MLEKLKKRRAFPVASLDGVYVRLLTQGEKPRANKVFKTSSALLTKHDGETDGEFAVRSGSFGENAKTWFVMGLVTCDETGAPAFTQAEGETDDAFAARVEAESVDVDDFVLQEIGSAFAKLSSGERVPIENLVKN